MVLFANFNVGFIAENCIADWLYSWKHTLVECKTFMSYFPCHSENLDKIFTLCDCPYKFNEVNVLSELKLK